MFTKAYVPTSANRPEIFFRHHPFDGFYGGKLFAIGTALGIEFELGVPVTWREVTIYLRPGPHEQTRVIINLAGGLRGGGGIGPCSVIPFEHVNIAPFHVLRREIITSIQPCKNGWVHTKIYNLIVPAFLGDVGQMWRPVLPALEGDAAAPAHHDQDALLVTTLEKIIRTSGSFHPDRVQVHKFQ